MSTGSSPRARGTQRHARRADAVRRFIPARAGNARTGDGVEQLASVHPRARGEHSSQKHLIHRTYSRCQRAHRVFPLRSLRLSTVLSAARLAAAGRNDTSRSHRDRPGRGGSGRRCRTQSPRRSVPPRRSPRCPSPMAPRTWSQIISRVRRRVGADVDAGPDLQQPDGEPAAQPRRRVLNHDDQHRPARLRVGKRRRLRVLRRLRRLEAAGGQHLLDRGMIVSRSIVRRNASRQSRRTALSSGRSRPALRARAATRNAAGHDGLELEQVRDVIDERERLAGVQEADRRAHSRPRAPPPRRGRRGRRWRR